MTASMTEPTHERVEHTVRQFNVKTFGKHFYQEFQRDRLSGLAQEIAYNLIFAIPPLLVLMVTLAALLNNVFGVGVADALRTAIVDHAPGSAQALLQQLVDDAITQVGGGAISLGLIVSLALAIYGASGGIGSLMDSFNIAYEVEETRSFIKHYLVQFGLILIVGGGIVLSFVLFVFGRRIGNWVASLFGLGALFTSVWGLLSWPIAVLIVLLLLAALYYLGPNVKQSFVWISPGSAVAAICWIAAIFGFKLYLAVSDPGSAYGAAGSVIVLLFFLYVTGLIFVVGAEINAMLAKRYDYRTIQDLLTHPQKAQPQAENEAERSGQKQGKAEGTGSSRPTGASHGASATISGRGEERPKLSLASGVAALGLAAAIVIDALRHDHGHREEG